MKMDEREELLFMDTKANDIKIKLEETTVLSSDVQQEAEFALETRSDKNMVHIKLEVKEEHLWEDGSEEIKHKPEAIFESVSISQITKEESVSEYNGVDLPSSESTRLNTKADYLNSYTCTSPLEKGHSPPEQVTLDCKPSSVYTVRGKNDNEESSSRQSFCSILCNPPLENDYHNKIVESASGMVEHRITHEGKRLHRCEHCEKRFKKKYDLKNHILIHSGAKPFKCDSCKKSFNKKSSLIRHIVLHSGKKPYKCDTCDKSFNSNSNLKGHIVCHSGIKPYKCVTCGKSFNSNSNLKAHSMCHSGIKPYKCATCDKRFNSNANLKAHIVCHSDIKPYKCDICKKSYNNKSNLLRHVACHSDTKPFKCDNCEKSFKRKSCLKRHALCHLGSETQKLILRRL